MNHKSSVGLTTVVFKKKLDSNHPRIGMPNDATWLISTELIFTKEMLTFNLKFIKYYGFT